MEEITSEIISNPAIKEDIIEDITINEDTKNREEGIDKEENKSENIEKIHNDNTTKTNTDNVSIKRGNPLWVKGKSANPNGRPKGKVFSIREDLIKSLKRIKKKKPELYQQIIDSYWLDNKMRQFLLEIVDGKARQSMELSGTMENPVRMIEIKQQEEKENEAKT